MWHTSESQNTANISTPAQLLQICCQPTSNFTQFSFTDPSSLPIRPNKKGTMQDQTSSLCSKVPSEGGTSTMNYNKEIFPASSKMIYQGVKELTCRIEALSFLHYYLQCQVLCIRLNSPWLCFRPCWVISLDVPLPPVIIFSATYPWRNVSFAKLLLRYLSLLPRSVYSSRWPVGNYAMATLFSGVSI